MTKLECLLCLLVGIFIGIGICSLFPAKPFSDTDENNIKIWAAIQSQRWHNEIEDSRLLVLEKTCKLKKL